jgi:hypothetical protein
VHSYRHRYGLTPCGPAYEATEKRITERPVITVSTVVLDAAHDGLGPRLCSGRLITTRQTLAAIQLANRHRAADSTGVSTPGQSRP